VTLYLISGVEFIIMSSGKTGIIGKLEFLDPLICLEKNSKIEEHHSNVRPSYRYRKVSLV
jgi:hypothetical protein